MRWTPWYTAGVIGFIFAVLFLAGLATQLELTPHNHLGFWSAVIIGVLILALMIVIGLGTMNRFDGILIDSTNRITLATFQLVVWTLVVLTSYGGALATNLLANVDPIHAFNVTLPPELWIAIGISGSAFVGAKVIGRTQGSADANTDVPDGHPEQAALQSAGIRARGSLAVRSSPAEANWGDLFVSDKISDGMHVDVARVQMFFFTVILAVGYLAAVADELIKASGQITELPKLDSGFVTLLAISQGAYLTGKVVKGNNGSGTATPPPPDA